jgi:hypothetical protein
LADILIYCESAITVSTVGNTSQLAIKEIPTLTVEIFSSSLALPSSQSVIIFICHTTPPNTASPLVEIASRDRRQNPRLPAAGQKCHAMLPVTPGKGQHCWHRSQGNIVSACIVRDWLIATAIQINTLKLNSKSNENTIY